MAGLAWRHQASGADPDCIRTSEWGLGYDFRVVKVPQNLSRHLEIPGTSGHLGTDFYGSKSTAGV